VKRRRTAPSAQMRIFIIRSQHIELITFFLIP
jgi:hypothetical protein